MQEFSYEQIWELEEPSQRPHKIRADEFGISVVDVPVSPILTRLERSIERIETIFNVWELEEEGIDVRELLNHYTEVQVINYLEERSFENAITLGEIEALLFSKDCEEILQIPKFNSNFFLARQFEEASNGSFIDVSVFNTVDFERYFSLEFDSYKYFTDKVAEKVKDLAILHSCLSSPEGREQIKQRFVSLVNGKHRNYASSLVSMIKSAQDDCRKANLMDKLQERNKQIRRLRAIWRKYAYVS